MLVDPRVRKQAQILVDYSTKVKAGDVVQIVGNELAKPLILEVYQQVLKRQPKEVITDIGFDELMEIYFAECEEQQLKKFPQLKFQLTKNTDVFIYIRSPLHTRLLSGVNPQKQAIRTRTLKPITDYRVENTRWVITAFPTPSMAQEADMSPKEFADFVFAGIVEVNWEKKQREQKKLKEIFDKAKEVRIVGEGTDLKLSKDGRNTVMGNGEFNMPDGEVFTSVIEDSADGYIHFTYPAIYQGREVEDVRLEFQAGKVVAAQAKKGKEFLERMLDMDQGARLIGELGIGNNYHIQRFIKDILFDEKIGGTIHIALGRGYQETGSRNDSALHWDMIKDLRKGGELYLDGKLVQKNGQWLVKL